MALDFDGTLADLGDDPMAVRPREGNVDLVSRLSALPNTEVVILSGRQLRDLRFLSGMEHVARLVGSHGAEPQDGLALSDAESSLLEAVDLRCARSWRSRRRSRVGGAQARRPRPARAAAGRRGAQAPLDHAMALLPPVGGVHVTEGKDILELAVLDVTKGSYLEAARNEYGADAVLFIGDDVTDERSCAPCPTVTWASRSAPRRRPQRGDAFLPDTAAVTAFLREFAGGPRSRDCPTPALRRLARRSVVLPGRNRWAASPAGHRRPAPHRRPGPVRLAG